MVESKREQILQEMERVFSETVKADTNFGTTWGRVLDSDYEGREMQGQNVMAIIEGTETYLEFVAPDKLDRNLFVELRTRVYVPMGTNLRTGANRVLADLEQIIFTNELWGNLAMATFPQSNDVFREDTGDRSVEISYSALVRYRAKRTDPRG